jgi:hypothetical protein
MAQLYLDEDVTAGVLHIPTTYAYLYLNEDVTAGVLHLPITYAYLCRWGQASRAYQNLCSYILNLRACDASLCLKLRRVTLLETPKPTPKPKLQPQGCLHVPIHTLTVAVVLLLLWMEYD